MSSAGAYLWAPQVLVKGDELGDSETDADSAYGWRWGISQLKLGSRSSIIMPYESFIWFQIGELSCFCLLKDRDEVRVFLIVREETAMVSSLCVFLIGVSRERYPYSHCLLLHMLTHYLPEHPNAVVNGGGTLLSLICHDELDRSYMLLYKKCNF